jgi:hypothetical protein
MSVLGVLRAHSLVDYLCDVLHVRDPHTFLPDRVVRACRNVKVRLPACDPYVQLHVTHLGRKSKPMTIVSLAKETSDSMM